MSHTEMTQQERQHSFLQRELPKRQLEPHAYFVEDGKIHPVTFELLEMMNVQNKRVAEKFSHVQDLHVLKGKRREKESPTGKRIAVLFSGGPAAGGHNVLLGIKHALGQKNTLLGVRDGPGGLLKGDVFEIGDISHLANTGGFDFLGTDRTKIKNIGLLKQARRVCEKHNINGIIIIGGDDSNTNAAILAEYLMQDGIQVIGVPKTMDGDLQAGEYLPTPFGFDTATKIYANLVGNLARDAISSRKYWHIVRLMGRDASHVTLEVALQIKPQVVLISEEIAQKKMKLHKISDEIAHIIVKRASHGKDYGTIIIPEGLLESIPEFHDMLDSVSKIIKEKEHVILDKPLKKRRAYIAKQLNKTTRQLYTSLPDRVQEMLTLNRDDHGNLKVSQIPTEELFVEMLQDSLERIAPGFPLKTVTHFFGYEGRCGPPSKFDAMLGYNLGLTAGSLILDGRTGYMAAFNGFDNGGNILAVPLVGLLDVEERRGEPQFVIKKAAVEMTDPAFKYVLSRRTSWAEHDLSSNPGPIQFLGPSAAQVPFTVALNKRYKSLFYKV